MQFESNDLLPDLVVWFSVQIYEEGNEINWFYVFKFDVVNIFHLDLLGLVKR